MKKIWCIAGCCLWAILARGQSLSPDNNRKLSPRLQGLSDRAWMPAGRPAHYLLQCTDTAAFRQSIAALKDSIIINYAYGNILDITAWPPQVGRLILPLPAVRFIDLNDRKAKEEVTINGFDYTANQVNLLHSAYPALTGIGHTVSIKEDKPDSTDIDFKGRFLASPLSSNTVSSHATIMGTIIAGGGNSYYTARGVAPGAGISPSSFVVLLPDSDAYYHRYQVEVQNHSYGTGIENYYGADAAAYDASAINNPSLLHVFSAGNSGDQASTAGRYAGIGGVANLTGSFKQAKNILTVGSIDSFAAVPLLSSRGPAFDGRVKPDLVAFGEDGSSGAAALVSGTALVLQQVYRTQKGVPADAALVKAFLLNSAAEVGSAGIDFNSGFGSLDAARAVKEMQQAHFFSGTVAQGRQQSYPLPVPANARNLKVLLTWTDKDAPANAAKALVNDLDLTLTNPAAGQSWQPWVLNSAPSPDSLALLPVQKRDSLNTAEQITVSDPLAGNYTITVSGYALPAGAQSFFVVYQWDTAASFQWTYPAGTDNLLPGQTNLIRWQSNYNGNGLPEYQLAGTNQWQTIQAALSLSTHYLSWAAPDTTALALLRMTINGQPYVSDSFTISPRPLTGVGFNCPDSLLLYWDKAPGNQYLLYRLGDQYLQPVQVLADTAVVLPVSPSLSNWYAVSAVLPFNHTGLKSFAFDYTQQGVDCYIGNFTADLAGAAAALRVVLGSNYRVTNVVVEKRYAGGYLPLQAFGAPVVLHYSLYDSTLVNGLNTYRVMIILSGGQVVYSDEETVYYFGNSDYIIYPNPVARQQSIHIIASALDNPVFQLFNASGQKVLEQPLYNLVEDIPTGTLTRGLYFYVIRKSGKNNARGKIIIQ